MRRNVFAVLLGFGLLCCAARLPALQHSADTKPLVESKAVENASPEPWLAERNCAVGGTVQDEKGTAIAGANVQLTEAATSAVHALITDASGQYCAVELQPGSYSLTVQNSGFSRARIDVVRVSPGQVAQVNAVLAQQPEGAAASVAVIAILEQMQHQSGAPPPAERPKQPHAKAPAPKGNPSGGDALGEAEAAWFKQLPNGSIQYKVPNPMVIGQSAAVTATINGFKAPAPSGPPGSTAPAPLKVSEWMRVELTEPDNPDAFTIAIDPSQNPQFVPIDAGATWTWTVTPRQLGKDEKLQFQAFVLYNDQGKIRQALPSAQYTVTVHSEGVVGLAHIFENAFWLNPTNWFRYMLPGGAGFGALVAVIAWWRKKRKKTASERAKKKA